MSATVLASAHVECAMNVVQHAFRLRFAPLVAQLEAHAETWAADAVRMIDRDVRKGHAISFDRELRTITAHDEWGVAMHDLERHRVLRLNDVPIYLEAWVRGVWCGAFARALSTHVAKRSACLSAWGAGRRHQTITGGLERAQTITDSSSLNKGVLALDAREAAE